MIECKPCMFEAMQQLGGSAFKILYVLVEETRKRKMLGTLDETNGWLELTSFEIQNMSGVSTVIRTINSELTNFPELVMIKRESGMSNKFKVNEKLLERVYDDVKS